MVILNRSIEYDVEHLEQDFTEILKKLTTAMQSEIVRHAIGKDLSTQVFNTENLINKKLKTDFSLVIVGNFKRGKSTLVNALLGDEVVTTSINPETMTINQIKYGAKKKLEICLFDGGKIKLEEQELSSDKLVPILKQLPQKVSHLNIEVPVEWLKGTCLVDTPGIGDIFNRFDRQIHEYLRKADAVIFAISALSPLSKSEQAFLKLSIAPHDFPKLFFVVNMMDFVRTEEEAQLLLQDIEKRTLPIFPGACIFGLSAFDEICRLKSLKRPAPDRAMVLEQQFQTFRDSLQESILLNRDLIQLARASNQLEQILRRLQSNLVLLRQAIQSDRVKIGRAIAQFQDESSELHVKINQHQQQIETQMLRLSTDAVKWLEEFVDRLEKEAIASIPEFKISQLQRHYHFFLTDALRQAITECVEAHQGDMVEIAESAARSISEEFQTSIEVNLARPEIGHLTFEEEQWTNLETLDWALHVVHLNLVVGPLIHLVKESGASKEAAHYQHKIHHSLPELKHSLIQQIESIYREITQDIQKQVQAAYEKEIEASLSALRQAEELSENKEQSLAGTNRGLQEASAILSDSLSTLKDFQTKLWSNLAFN